MGNIFRIDSPLMQGLTKFTNWMIINIITVVMCIPVFTIGAAVTAMYDVLGRMERGQEVRIIGSYFRAFRSNFKQATVMWLILLLAGIALGLVVWVYMVNDVPGKQYWIGFTSVVAIFWLMVLSWVFPLQAQFANPVKRTMNNAVLGSLGYLPRSAGMALVNALPWIMLYNKTNLFLYLLPIWTTIWFSLGAIINLRLLKKILQQFMEPQEKGSEMEGVEDGTTHEQ